MRAYERNTIVYGYTKNATNTQPSFLPEGLISFFASISKMMKMQIQLLQAIRGFCRDILYFGRCRSKFSIDSSTGKLLFLELPDFEIPSDSNSDNEYEVIIRASDGTLYSNKTLPSSSPTFTNPPNPTTMSTSTPR